MTNFRVLCFDVFKQNTLLENNPLNISSFGGSACVGVTLTSMFWASRNPCEVILLHSSISFTFSNEFGKIGVYYHTLCCHVLRARVDIIVLHDPQ